jgi:hypothetical protein
MAEVRQSRNPSPDLHLDLGDAYSELANEDVVDEDAELRGEK